MTMTDDHIALAAEYVLGTLDLAEREEAQRLIAANADFADMVRRWEARLGELHQLVAPVEPPATSWEAIKARIAALRADELAGAGPRRASADAGDQSDDRPGGSAGHVVMLHRRVRRWRSISTGLGALAAALVILIATQALRPDLLPPALRAPVSPGGSGQFVAVLQKDADAPAFIMSVDIATRTFTVRRVSARDAPDKSYELWLVSDKFAAPKSLGVIGDQAFTISARLASYDRETINNATYAVSIEPKGGSPTGTATGPVVYTGKLVDALPAER